MNHPDQKTLHDFLNGDLTDQKNQEVDQHLSNCADCRTSVEIIIDGTIGCAEVTDTTPLSADGQQSLPNEIGLRFVVAEEIARGGMGVVYRGFDRELKRDVAIKISNSDQLSVTARFFREAQISAQLQHPGIVPVHELGRLANGKPYIAMRLVKGQTLTAIVKETSSVGGKLRHLDVFGQICSAMAFAHSKQVIHRDLKPDNVMVGAFGEVQIMDWGLAKKTGQHDDDSIPHGHVDNETNAPQTIPINPAETQLGQVLGTPAYMAPEQAKGQNATKRTDVFSLGGILFHMLTGRVLFDAASTTQAIAKSADSDLERAFALLDETGVDADLINLAKSCLAAEPDSRPADAEQVKKLFNEYTVSREQERQSLKVEEARVKERLVAQQKRSRLLTIFSMAMAVALVVSAVSGYMYIQERSARAKKQNQINEEQLEAKIRDELVIRESIDKATKHQLAATGKSIDEQSAIWALALKEIEKGVPFLSDSIDDGLHNEFNLLATAVRKQAGIATRDKERLDTEKACRADILVCCEESYYPEDMKFCRDERLNPRFAIAFGDLGCISGTEPDKAAFQLTNSTFKDDFLLGLLTWQREVAIESRRPAVKRRPTAEINAERDWLREVVEQADPDPFRAKLRRLFTDGQRRQLVMLLNQAEAVDSIPNVHAVATILRYVFPDVERRITYLRRAHQRFPDDFFINWYLLVLTTDRETRIQYALSCYSLRPQNAAVLAAVGTASILRKEYERAVEVLEQLVELEPGYRSGFTNLAIAYGKVGRDDEALKYFDTALNMNSALKNIGSVHQYRAEFHHDRGNMPAAIDGFQQWSALEPENPKPYDEIAAIYHDDLKDFEKAVAIQREAVFRRPDYKWYQKRLNEYYQSLSESLQQAHRYEEAAELELAAIRDFSRVAELAPKSFSPHEELSKLSEQLDNFEQAMKSLRQAILLRPNYAYHHNRLASLCYVHCRKIATEGKTSEAVQRLKSTTKFLKKYGLKPQWAIPLYEQLTHFTFELESYDESIEAIKVIIKLKPHDRASIARLGRLYIRNDQLDLAEETFQQLLKTRSDDAGAVAGLAKLYLAKKMPEKSEAVILEAIKNDINSQELQLVYGETLVELGRRQNSPEKTAEGRKILDSLEAANIKTDGVGS